MKLKYILAILSLSVGGFFWYSILTAPEPVKTLESPVNVSEFKVTTIPQKPFIEPTGTLQLINRTRVELGLGALAVMTELNQSATEKCNDMVAKNYWAHDAPDGTKPWDIIIKYTYYSMAGEILATGFLSNEAQHQGWLDSQGHYDEIVRPEYQYFGVGECAYANGQSLTVVHFVRL
jgi:hypothetical protein